MIRGIVKSGSYKGCIVTVLNDGVCNGLGNVSITAFKDICKYKISIVNKPISSDGKKKIGEITYLDKESIFLQPNCLCIDDKCMLSHLPPSSPLSSSSSPSTFPLPPPLTPNLRTELIEILVRKYALHRGLDSVISIRISHETMKQYGGNDHINAFVRMACLCTRVLAEQYCKEVTLSNLPAREMLSIAFTKGVITKEKERELADVLTFSNGVIHSCCLVPQVYFFQKIDRALYTLSTL